MLLTAAFIHMGWFLIFNVLPWPRYVLAVLMLEITCTALLTVHRKLWMAMPVFIFITFLGLGSESRHAIIAFWTLREPIPPHNIDLLAATHFVQTHPAPVTSPYAGCGWATSRQIEYLLPTTLNFIDCKNKIKAALPSEEIIKTYHEPKAHIPLIHKFSIRFVADKIGLFFLVDPTVASVLNQCDQTPALFASEWFTVFSCDVEWVSLEGVQALQDLATFN